MAACTAVAPVVYATKLAEKLGFNTVADRVYWLDAEYRRWPR
jgi:hypothetical protein